MTATIESVGIVNFGIPLNGGMSCSKCGDCAYFSFEATRDGYSGSCLKAGRLYVRWENDRACINFAPK